MRRVLIILAIIIVLAGVAGAGYFYFFASSPDLTVTPGGSANFPTAGGSALPPSEEPGTGAASAPGAAVPVSARLVKISAGPVVEGEAVVSTEASASSSAVSTIRYIDRQSGNVYSYDTSARTITRTSNRTVPGLQSALWTPDATLAFVRYLSGADARTVNSYALYANGADGFFLSQNISDLAVSSSSVLTLASGVNGSVASLAHLDGTHTTQLFTTPLSDVRLSFAGKGQYLAFTKPSATLPGTAFIVDGAGNFSRIAGPLNGLVAKASPSGKWVLVSYTNNGTLQMQLVSTVTGETIALPVATIADKCVWTADDTAIYCGIPVEPPTNAAYPDDWYQGALSFSDRIWKIEVNGRYAQFVLDFLQENDTPLDAEALAIDPHSLTLVFVNKIDGSLWSYAL